MIAIKIIGACLVGAGLMGLVVYQIDKINCNWLNEIDSGE